MIESRSAARRRRRKGVPNKTISSKHVYPVDNSMVLLIGLEECDTKKIMKLCDNEIGFTQTVTIHPVENVGMSKEYIQQYKERGFTFCAIVIFRFYKPNYENCQLQKELLQQGLTTIKLENKQHLVTHKRCVVF